VIVGDKSKLVDLSKACISASAAGLTFHDLQSGRPPSGENCLGTAAVVDTATTQGQQQIRKLIGPRAEEVLSVHPGRFVIYALQPEGAWVRICPTEDLVIFEVLKIVRDAPEPPATYEVLLFLEPAFRLRVNRAVADEALRRSETGGRA
jgi:hypothetical protein